MKLVVQIPCFNEEATLAATVADVPRRVAGVDSVEVLVVDDGSTDASVAVARSAGADFIVRHARNRGLAAAFRTGVDACMRLGAHFVVNMDANGQYRGADIPRLIAPLVAGEADIVVGDRQTGSLDHFSPGKRLLQRLGSSLIARLAGLSVPDAVSGFRAFTREAAPRPLLRVRHGYLLPPKDRNSFEGECLSHTRLGILSSVLK